MTAGLNAQIDVAFGQQSAAREWFRQPSTRKRKYF
jgi:hypothetical protein